MGNYLIANGSLGFGVTVEFADAVLGVWIVDLGVSWEMCDFGQINLVAMWCDWI